MLEKAAGRESEREGEAGFLLARSGMDTEDTQGQLGGGAGFRKGSEGNFTPTTLARALQMPRLAFSARKGKAAFAPGRLISKAV